MRRLFGLLLLGSLVTGCSTLPEEPISPDVPAAENEEIPKARPLPEPPPAPRVQTPPPPPVEPPPAPVIEAPEPSEFAALPFWNTHDPTPA